MHLRDRSGRERIAVEAGEDVIDLGTQLRAKHLLDLQPRDLGDILLQTGQLFGELGRQQVSPRREDLPELDERDATVLECDSQRTGELNAPIVRLELCATGATKIRKHSPTDHDPADLGVAPAPTHPPAQGSDHVQRAGRSSARHQRLCDDDHDHPD